LPSLPRTRPEWLLRVLGLAVLTAVTTWYSITLTRFGGGVAALCVANGLLTGALLVSRRSSWAGCFAASALGQLVVRFVHDSSGPLAVAIVLINLLESGMVAWWLRRQFGRLQEASDLGAVARDALLSTLVACFASATLALPLLAHRLETTPWVTWSSWFTSHVLGMVVVATLTACALLPQVGLVVRAGRRLDYALCLSLLLLTCYGVFAQQSYPLLFMIYLPLLLLVWRHGITGMMMGIVLLAGVSGVAAVQDAGPFALIQDGTGVTRVLFWKAYVAAGCLLAFSTAVALAQRRQLEQKLKSSKARYRILADHSQDLIVRRRPDGSQSYVSPASVSLLGLEPEELFDADALVHPDDLVSLQSVFAQLFADGGQATLLFRMRHRDGRYVWLEAAAQAVDVPHGRRVIYSARDVSTRVRAERGQAALQAQLQAITDHLPAMVARFDREGRFVYANERSRVLRPGFDPIGRHLLEVRGEAAYADIAPHIEAVLRGEQQDFDTFLELPDGRMEIRAQFVPDVAADGSVQGFYSLSFDISEEKAHKRELERLARFDPLTGLANRRHFDESLEDAVARAARNGSALLLLALDVDNFKQINDSLGHAGGDLVLKAFAQRISEAVYEVDLVARLGGDEFAVLVEYSPDVEAGARIAERVVAAMREPVLIEGQAVQVTASIGVGRHWPTRSGEALMALADKALYEAKARGRNTWAIAQDEPQHLVLVEAPAHAA
jgi:diguanylate cyclase (GGDEF)-like protein/PAS domain S-box-containing protein